MPSSSLRSAPCSTMGVARYSPNLSLHLRKEESVYRCDDFTSMGVILCRAVSLLLAVRKSIYMRSLASSLLELL